MRKHKSSGFTLIEIVVSLAIAVMSVFTIAKLFQTYLNLIVEEKFKVTAVALANQQIETIRNLPYADIGTVGGIPPGQIEQEQQIVRNNITFDVKTEIIYIDDPFDGLITTTGSSNSIYNSTNPNLTYYWSMESNTSSQSPDVGYGTITTNNINSVAGNQGNGLEFDSDSNSSAVTQISGNIDPNQGRLGFWFKPTDNFDGYFFEAETTNRDFRIYEVQDNRIRFDYGDANIRSQGLTWNEGQWYFIEAAWDASINYREIWRDGIPLNVSTNSLNPPTFGTDMHIGQQHDTTDNLNGTLDELYILNTPYQYQIWGYNQSNPYFESNPQVTFYWNMDDGSSSQTPQIGDGTISLGGSYEQVTPAVQNNGIEFSDSGNQDYALLPTTNNLNFSTSRIGFWYKPRQSNPWSWNSPHLLNAANCTNGSFALERDNSNKLIFSYGSVGNEIELESQALSWNRNWWYFIEIAWDSDNDYAAIYVNREEVASDTLTDIEPPISCNGLYAGNENNLSTNIAEGSFDELYFLNDATPESDDQDTLNTDYKRAKVTVSWSTPRGDKKIYTISDIAPPGIETTDGGGTLILHTFNSNGLPVAEANVHIYNDTLDPVVDLNLTTNVDGELILPGAPAATSSYQVTVSKTGYSTDQTYAATSTYPNPIRPHLSVLEGQTTEASFAIDTVSVLTVQAVSQSLPVNWKINTDDTETDQHRPAVTAGNYFYFAWEDIRNEISEQIYTEKYSTVGVKQWTSDKQIHAGQNQYDPRLIIDATENQYIAWWDDSSGNPDIYLSKYTSAGTDAWSGPVTVNNTNAEDQKYPDVAFANNLIHVVWHDERNDQGDIYYNSFDQTGNKQHGSDIIINTDSGTNLQSYPKIFAANDQLLYIAWLDDREGKDNVYLQLINDTGTALWGNEILVNESAATQINSLCITADSEYNAFVTWDDNRNGNYDIWLQSIATTSDLLLTQDTRIVTQSSSANQQKPNLAVDTTDNLYIAWQDDRSGDNDIYVLQTDIDGIPTWPQELRLNLEPLGDQYLSDLAVYNSNKIIAVWTDYGQDDDNVWAGTLNYDGSETPVPYLDFDLRGSKLIYESPDFLKYEQSLQTDASGQLILTDMEWDTYEIDVTDALYSLQQADPETPFLLEAGTSTSLKLIVN